MSQPGAPTAAVVVDASTITTTSVPAPPRPGTPALFTLQTLPAAALPPAFLRPIRALHAACFPADALPAEESDTIFLDRVAWLHEPAECVWILCWRGGAAPELRASDLGARQSSPLPPLVAMCTAVPYPSSLFGFNLAVHPAWRGAGLGRRVMHELQAAALARFGQGAISATVDAAGSPALVRYYCSFGGVVEATGVTAPDAPPPPTVRVVRRFDAPGLAAATAEADAVLLAGGSRRPRAWRRRWRRAVARVVAAAVVVAGGGCSGRRAGEGEVARQKRCRMK
jgi:GNAT superfamily N-acetyltransferase